MCHYTITFFECGHKTEDNVRGCWRHEETGDFCDIDNPEVRRRDSCSIRSREQNGVCKRCLQREQERMEQEALQKDIEKAKALDAEEQQRRREAHEAHLRRVEEESKAEWQRMQQEEVDRVIKESAEQAAREQAAKEAAIMNDIMEASKKEFLDKQRREYGDAVEEGSTHMEAIMGKSTMDWHHKRWGPGAEDDTEEYDDHEGDIVSEVQVKMETSFKVTNSQHDAAPPPPPSPPPPPPPVKKASDPSRAAPKPLAPVVPVDFSQPPKDQNYGRFMLGGRHQPIHPSQELPASPITPATPKTPTFPRAPAQPSRLAGAIPPSAPSPGGFSIPIGDLRSNLRSTAASKRPAPRPPPRPAQDEVANELAALWSKKGIKKEDDEDSNNSVTPSQSASQVPSRETTDLGRHSVQGSRAGTRRAREMQATSEECDEDDESWVDLQAER